MAGLEVKYNVSKIDGTVDENASYFVLRLDDGCENKKHHEACLDAVITYARAIRDTNKELHDDLMNLYGWNRMTEKLIKLVEIRNVLKHDETTYKQYFDEIKEKMIAFFEFHKWWNYEEHNLDNIVDDEVSSKTRNTKCYMELDLILDIYHDELLKYQ